jgi:hypothetical protein
VSTIGLHKSEKKTTSNERSKPKGTGRLRSAPTTLATVPQPTGGSKRTYKRVLAGAQRAALSFMANTRYQQVKWVEHVAFEQPTPKKEKRFFLDSHRRHRVRHSPTNTSDSPLDRNSLGYNAARGAHTETA